MTRADLEDATAREPHANHVMTIHASVPNAHDRDRHDGIVDDAVDEIADFDRSDGSLAVWCRYRRIRGSANGAPFHRRRPLPSSFDTSDIQIVTPPAWTPACGWTLARRALVRD